MSPSSRKNKAASAPSAKRQQQTYLLIAVVGVVLIGMAVVIMSSMPATNPAAASAAEADGGEASTGGSADGLYAGIERGVTEDGVPRLGSPDAPVTMTTYSSFGCGHCANFHNTALMELINNEVRAGEVQVVYVLVTNQFSVPASAAAFCAMEQGAFWEMQDLLFDWLAQYGGNAYPLERLMQGAEILGLDTEEFESCLNSQDVFDRMNASNDLFAALAQEYEGEVTGTPTIAFNGVPPEVQPGHRSGAMPIEMVRQFLAEAGS